MNKGLFLYLENKQRYTLGKTERLKSRKVIEQLFKEGKSFSNFPFRVVYIYQPNDLPNGPDTYHKQLQTAFSVSTKLFKKAVERNRIKRQMREAYRLQKIELESCVTSGKQSLSVFIIYTGNEMPEYKVVVEKMGSLLKRLTKFIGENNNAAS